MTKKLTSKKTPAAAKAGKAKATKKPAAAPKKKVHAAPAKKTSTQKKPIPSVPTPAPAVPARTPPKHKFDQKTLDAFRNELLKMRDRLVNQNGSMKDSALKRTDEENPEEDGTDAFLRLQTLEQVSSQQEILANIDKALRAIAEGVYGVCDNCGELISRQRLQVLPFAKNCINCQAEMERTNRGESR